MSPETRALLTAIAARYGVTLEVMLGRERDIKGPLMKARWAAALALQERDRRKWSNGAIGRLFGNRRAACVMRWVNAEYRQRQDRERRARYVAARGEARVA